MKRHVVECQGSDENEEKSKYLLSQTKHTLTVPSVLFVILTGTPLTNSMSMNVLSSGAAFGLTVILNMLSSYVQFASSRTPLS
jgi:hypothetical protein